MDNFTICAKNLTHDLHSPSALGMRWYQTFYGKTLKMLGLVSNVITQIPT